MGINNSFKTSWMVLCFGSAGLLLSVAWQEPDPMSPTPRITRSSENTNSNPVHNQSTKGEWIGSQSFLDWALGFNSPFPLAQLLIQNPSFFHPQTLQEVSPVIPYLKMAIASSSSRLVVDLSEAEVYVYWGEQRQASYPIAVGQPGWETPTGTFKVLQKQKNPVWQQPITGDLIPAGSDNPLGDRWIGFWSDQRHQIGFHGTNDETLVGQAISHGCLRMRNADIQALYEQVSVGTPVIVRD